MATHPVETIRNIVLAGHGAAGKTTLADLMLFKAGANSRAGSVDDGTSLLDTEDDEKERKHSITSAVCHFDHAGTHVNLIDAPGYPDFVGQAVGAMRAVETAIIVVNATHGIAVNTRKMFALAGDNGLARMLVINRCDGDNIQFQKLVDTLRETFGTACALMNVPVGLGGQFSAVVNTVNLPGSIPAGVAVDPKAANQQVMDAAVEADEALMERYLEGGELTADEVSHAITKAIAAGTLVPIFCTSAKKGVGVPELMDAIAAYAPPPTAIVRKGMKGDQEVPLEPNGPFVAQVFKTRIDPFVAKMSYLRVFSGSLKKDGSVRNERTGKSFKAAQLLKVQGGQTQPLTEVGPGDIVAIVKVDDLKTGDTLTHGADGLVVPPLKFPTPMIGLALEPKTQADQAKISTAVHKIEEEDPTFVIRRNAQTKEMVMNGMSELHLQLVQNRLHKREKVDVVTHPPKVPYRETIHGQAEGSYRHKKQTGGSGQFAEVHFRMFHCPPNVNPEEYFTDARFHSMRDFRYDAASNYCFVDSVTGGTVPNNFIPAVEKGIKERMEQGVLAGYHVQDVIVELFFGKDHPVDSNETAFKIAGSMCFKETFLKAKPVLLEPIVNMEIIIPQEKLGDITSDLNTRRGRMEGMDTAPGGFQIVKAKAPLAEVMTYARALSSMTGGQGSFTLEFSHYDLVPPNEQQKIVAAAAKKVEEEH
jgi:elongation factor G